MGRLYTLDEKLLVDTPEVRIGDKIYAVDDRAKTMKKLNREIGALEDQSDEVISKAFEIALGKKAAQEIEAMDLHFPAYKRAFELVMAAMTGEDPEAVAARFQQEKNEN